MSAPATFENIGHIRGLGVAIKDTSWLRDSLVRCAAKAATDAERNLHIYAAEALETLILTWEKKSEQLRIIEQQEAK